MKKIITPILALLLLASCGKIEEPEFRRLEKFGLKNLGMQDATVGFSATYYNPNKFRVTVKEANFDVYIDSIYMGQFTQPEPVDVNDKAEFSIPLEGKIAIQKALSLDLPNMIGKEVYVRAKGKVRIGKAGVFMTKDINYEGRQRISTDLIK
jgi:LEA14-like dessication related protein